MRLLLLMVGLVACAEEGTGETGGASSFQIAEHEISCTGEPESLSLAGFPEGFLNYEMCDESTDFCEIVNSASAASIYGSGGAWYVQCPAGQSLTIRYLVP